MRISRGRCRWGCIWVVETGRAGSNIEQDQIRPLNRPWAAAGALEVGSIMVEHHD